MGNDRLLLVANDLHHEFGHRISELKKYAERHFDVFSVSLVPPGYTYTPLKNHGKRFLRGWPDQVIHHRKPLVWKRGNDLLIRRTPLPTICGPIMNLMLLKRALRSLNPDSFDSILAQGPVPGKAAADTGFLFCYDHADNYWGGRVDTLHRSLLGRWQDYSIRRAHAVSCAGESLNDHAISLHAKKTAVFPNGVHHADFNMQRNENQNPTVVYVGGLERDCGLANAIYALPLLDQPVRMIVAGSGPFEHTLKRMASTVRSESVIEWRGPVTRRQVSELLSIAWIGLALFSDTVWNRHAFHLKIVEYMAAGLPYLTTPVGDAGRLTRSTGAGIVVDDDPRSISQSLSSLLAADRERMDMGSRGRTAALSYDWAAIGDAYTTWLADSVMKG